jgi:2-keto-4-pentenoate hydratase
MREQMGIAEPNLGPLTDVMLLDGTSTGDGGRQRAVVPDAAIQPRVEPEIALRLARPLAAGCTVDDVLDACAGPVALAGGGVTHGPSGGAFACLEVVDSVWSGYRFRLEDNTCDGSSAAWVVLGDPLPLDDLPGVGVRLLVDGAGVADASGAAAGGHPASGVAWLASEVGRRYGRRLEAGDVVITGGLTAAHPLPVGSVLAAVFSPASGPRVQVEVTRAG